MKPTALITRGAELVETNREDVSLRLPAQRREPVDEGICRPGGLPALVFRMSCRNLTALFASAASAQSSRL